MTGERADEAARSVLALFGRRLFGLPGTHLAVTARPGPPPRPWHYWWQAHLLDCMVDAHARGSATVPGRLIGRHLRGIRLRNWGRLPNRFYDDMAWLALAAHRAGRRTPSLDRALREALTDDLGGGAFWSLDRDFKNTAATGPIALHLARTGNILEASRLHDWLRANLADPRTGLFQDGLRLTPDGPAMVPHVFTYNQGPVLGTMLELGRLDEAASHIEAVATHLTHPGSRILRTHGDGDGGLFTGILTRYLALAAGDTRLPAESRREASGLVNAFADALWQGRDTRGWRGTAVTLFPVDTSPHGAVPVAHTVELATQLQAWMAFEAAAAVGV
ncbi:glycosyl hydrolase [Tessaracoccus sp. MC1679]|uniref:glycoside hydrolase family 76 protein n=1 Tax=Tessaracoccus sp. MC1679 TaxID=2760313 RepID=UPI001601DDC0|nr:glycosyl hydrolase [Tessaracoccus sp. MC1679]